MGSPSPKPCLCWTDLGAPLTQEVPHDQLMNCPTAVSATIAPDAATTAVSWTPPTATDNSGSVIVTPNLMPGVLLGTGFEVVIYIAIDESGNRAICNFVITVSGEL